jgi:ribonuclease HI
MSVPAPHYLLFSESSQTPEPGRWRFVLRSSDGGQRVVADDVEPDVRGERLELLTVVRGLEALGQPSRVTLMTPSPYVREGIRFGLAEWRRNGWRWEAFGEMKPVKNGDLWQRMDRALRFHKVECRHWRIDAAHRANGDGESPDPAEEGAPAGPNPRRRSARPRLGHLVDCCRRWLAESFSGGERLPQARG